jgi:hypothetical protein
MFWPAFWARLEDEKVTPVALDVVRPIAEKIITPDSNSVKSGTWFDINEEQIRGVLTALSAEASAGKAVYIAGGRLYGLDEEGKLVAEESEYAKPYAWPMAHDVRPASQSLGVKGCEDCHDSEAAFMFGNVAVDSPVAEDRDVVKTMADFENISTCYNKTFAYTFNILGLNIRGCYALVMLAFCAVLAAVLIVYGLKCLACIFKMLESKD